MAEDAKYPTIKPMIRSMTGLVTFVEKYIITASIIQAPENAAMIIAIEPPNEYMENKLNELPKKSITKATPRFAPSLIPRIDGPASGFLKSVCSNKPLTASDAPANSAVIACGKRDCCIICCHAGLFVSLPINIPNTLLNGI